MATKLCPDCAEQVPEKANVCRHCGHDFVAAAAEPAPTPRWPIVVFVIGLLTVAVGLTVVNQPLTMFGLAIGALGGYIWRYKVRAARARR
jgi:uncharacterized protein (DUF983 family)